MVMGVRWYELDVRRSWWLYTISLWNSTNISAIPFSQIYAAYGGIFIVMAVVWCWIFEGIAPDRFDIFGAAIALAGVAIIFYTPRKGEEKSIWSKEK